MAHDPVIEKLLSVIKTPSYDWTKSQSTPVYHNLTGTIAALIECKYLYEKHMALSGKSLKELELPFAISVEDFKNAINDKSKFNWDYSSDMALFSAGFYLNKAMQNIAAAFDKCLNIWIAYRYEIMIENNLPKEEDVYYSPVRARLLLISNITELNNNSERLMINLIKKFYKFYGTNDASNKIMKISNTLKVGDTFLYFIDNIPLTIEECLGLVFGRVNAYKHTVKGTRDRKGLFYPIEFAVACKATECVFNFWNIMLEDTKEFYKEKSPLY